MRYDTPISLNNFNAITSDKKNTAIEITKPKLMTNNRIEKNPCLIFTGSFSAARNRTIDSERPRSANDVNNEIVVEIRDHIP